MKKIIQKNKASKTTKSSSKNASKKSQSPVTISITNKKGGVGKTATVVNLAAGLAKSGNKVLVIDLDPSQANLTLSLIGRLPNDAKGIIRGLLDRDTVVDEIIYSTQVENLFIIPSEKYVNGKDADVEMALYNEIGRENFLKDLLSQGTAQTFDYILIDNGPKLGLLTVNGLNACDYFIVPTTTDILSLSGLADTLKVAQDVKRLNPNIKNLGFLMTRVDQRLKTTDEAQKFLKKQFKEEIFTTSISTNAHFISLPQSQKTIFDVEGPKEKGYIDFMNLTKEVISRVEETH